ncbi:MAG: hypothetical protein LBV74_04740, partial [Tannerella sp.]|nr:hypothetical protein [Tannerella sp.]
MKLRNRCCRWMIYMSAAVVLTGCATYYAKNIKLNQAIETGQFETANKLLEKDTKSPNNRNRLLYYLNRGYVSWMLDDYQHSVDYLNTAENVIDDYSKHLGAEALALITNPMVKPYRAEDFEVVMVNSFKAINYMQLDEREDAMVECRRINLKLNNLNDKYKDHKNRYQRDAFAHTMMGLLYDANGDYNNAFIAYRNALDVYETDYTQNFNVQPPRQLKLDILRTAYILGFSEELNFYERKFDTKYTPARKPEAEMIFFWMNGFGPVKDEWSINFTIVRGEGGVVTFANEGLGISFPFYPGSSSEKESFSDLKLVRVAFPKYVERKPASVSAVIASGTASYPLEPVEDINAIAFKTLNDRFMREMASSLLRVAAKQALEEVTRKEDKNAGAILSIVNAATEKADTRNWQCLPHGISYARIPLTSGDNKLALNVKMIDGKTVT